MKYLEDKQHYIDLYDLITIRNCLEMIDVCTKAYVEGLKKIDAKSKEKAEFAKAANWAAGQYLFRIKGDRYGQKEETIQKWIGNDQIRQEKYDKTPEPHGILCPNCKKLMHVRLKDLENSDNPLRMMFLFECSPCKKKKWIYEDSTERQSTPFLCPKCKAEAEMKLIKEGKDKIIWKTICSSCRFTETTIDDFKKTRIEREKKEEKDKKLLEEYREAFCSEEKGKEAFEYIESLPVAEAVYEEELKKFDSPAYQKVSQLRKLSIIDLEKLLNKIFEKEKYSKLSFDKPEMGRQVIVAFSVQDTNSSRKQDASTNQLQKLIKDILEDTNWRLMSDGISYRLCYLSGRLKGYESEEDFFELSGHKKEEETLEIDYDTKTKYMGNNVVQLAKLMGEHKGVENVRKRRLEKEHEGFFLEDGKGPYSCGICGENRYGNEIWWNLDGLRCADCWRNIKKDVIPSLGYKYDNDSVYFQDWQMKSDYKVQPGTRRKLEREGLLRPRNLKRQDGTVYCTIYLVAENKEFLEKHPKEKRQGMIITDLLGEKVEL